jgi:hypothetical protein
LCEAIHAIYLHKHSANFTLKVSLTLLPFSMVSLASKEGRVPDNNVLSQACRTKDGAVFAKYRAIAE